MGAELVHAVQLTDGAKIESIPAAEAVDCPKLVSRTRISSDDSSH